VRASATATPATILARVRELARTDAPLRCAIAWSGGVDSTVLLHLLRRARRLPRARLTLRALHVDHGLQPAAADFRRFCVRTARRWQLPLKVLKADVHVARGESVEQVARAARRAALAAALAPGEWLLTAQHADDQLETVLLALLRGAGPAGLAGMPARMPLGDSYLLRPLLDVQRDQILACARAEKLAWIDDPTNDQLRFDRNFLRSQVIPSLQGRWPAVSRTVARSARHCAAAADVLAQVAARDLALAADGPDLAIPVLRRWSAPRRAIVLRAWIQAAGARAPNERHMVQIESMLTARIDAHPELRLADLTLKRKGRHLHLVVHGKKRR
jgi:tRNA(Ile)-lysidine synthase